MGKQINSPYFEYCPSITPDGKYFFLPAIEAVRKVILKRCSLMIK
ncbi:MAG: PD40 domain-containing protein [Ignavibacteriales bacterium]|nr:PD40 domain-containing protein [Ignavibacteriales bacterium]